MSEKTFTDENFDKEVLKSETPVLVDFWAPWCGPCKMMGPIVEELATENADKAIKIGKLNVDENSAMAGKYGVMSIPTFLVFKNGEVVDQAVGGVSKEKLQELIDKNL
ncbi:MAG: thioredoxin [Candidatus Magasanikbacteria bacterium CG_4_9_14_3_um_filter_32_9]|uniref:Thioredoxin n=1 Tax=Candidatus Magasanikbacteria bacterium CG_4_9_14_3_um_filter_32_9 TaxID=1974644 RepID=A0A2M7Z5X4_9BACT|nr:MAG: thioredoxin [Candidatus Magasanikbacteria bacterium CG_4_9_14_3_um_filter_32_9]